MLGSLSKSRKNSKTNTQYPNYVGDLPVKLIQDIIDSFALTGDWTEIAGRTGITEKQIRLLSSKYKNDPTEISRVVFDQWLCRVPKPKDLAYLLICVKRFKDAEKLRSFIEPREWVDVEKRIRRVKGVDASRSTIGDPLHGSGDYESSGVLRQIPSEEESSYRLLNSSQPSSRRRGTPGVFSGNSSYVAPSGQSRFSMSDRTTERESDVLSQGPLHVPTNCSTRGCSPSQEADISQILERSLEFKMPYSLQLPSESEGSHPNIIPYFILDQEWIIKDFSRKERAFFINELTALTLLRHPNIIPLSGYCRFDDFDSRNTEEVVQHLVYPYMKNRDLRYYLLKESPDLKTRLTIVHLIGNALSFIHHHNYVHGDLTLTNILIDEFGHPYLSDFELTVPVDELESLDALKENKKVYCTPPFFPVHGRMRRYERDIYAFGIVLAYVFAHRVPVESHINMDGESLVTELLGSLVNDHMHMRPQVENICRDCVRYGDSVDLKKDSFCNDDYTIVKMVASLKSLIQWSKDSQSKGESDCIPTIVYQTDG